MGELELFENQNLKKKIIYKMEFGKTIFKIKG